MAQINNQDNADDILDPNGVSPTLANLQSILSKPAVSDEDAANIKATQQDLAQRREFDPSMQGLSLSDDDIAKLAAGRKQSAVQQAQDAVVNKLSDAQQAKIQEWQDRKNKLISLGAKSEDIPDAPPAQAAPAQAAAPAASAPVAAPSAKPADDNKDDDEELLSNAEKDYEPSAPAKSAARSAVSAPSASPASSQSAAPDAQVDLSGAQNLGSVAKLQQLQQQMKQQLALNAAGSNMANTVYAMSGKANPFEKQFEQQAKQAELGPNQYIQQVDFQKSDPNSPVSKTYRALAKSIYPDMKVGDNVSAADLEKVNPELGMIRTREDMVAMRRQNAQDSIEERKFRDKMLTLQMQDRQAARQNLQDVRQQQMDEKQKNSWSKTLATPSSRTVLGQAQNQMFSVDRVNALLTGHPLNEISPQEAAEVYKGLDRVISGGSPTIQGAKSLDPDTAMAGIANLLQRYTNTVHSAHSQDFLKRTQYNLAREKQVAKDKVKEMSLQLLAGADDYAERDPEGMRKFLRRSNLPTDMFDDVSKEEVMQHSNPNAPQVAAPGASAPFGIAPDALAAEIARRKAAKGGQ